MLVTEWDRTVAVGITHFAIIRVAELRGKYGYSAPQTDFAKTVPTVMRKLCGESALKLERAAGELVVSDFTHFEFIPDRDE
ncbi:hypothetical protein TNIN_259571 [Trichonephila inaurata madagascariensis]|uniref:Uncharacterized protein n=1 Tax=Trichonephila inaurata madagascariensis TaxID=2747483 RepID=A0A8X6WV24_9ARAC|nr:hypothetical protein TNIN_259571 [Trichonephila inaurata madagascariensis]